jgi:HK97 family phage portal protein
MNAYDFYYKIISKLMIKNNAFIKINKDFRGNVNSLYPIDYSSVTILDAGSEPLYEFRFSSGEVERLYTEEFIHLRRHFCSNDLLGTSNYEALKASLETLTTIDQGIVNNIKNSATLRGVIQYEKSFLRPEDIKRERDSFVNEYLNLEDSSGVAALDAKAKFIPLDNKGNPIDPQLHEIIKTKIFNYFGVNEKIINSSYNDSEWMSFYESVIEPIAVQMSLEFTNKLLTKERQRYGEQIIFQANKLVHASLEAKAKLLKEVMPMGLFTINEAREVLNLPVVEGGEQRLMSLNYVNADKADEYQLGEKTQDNQQEEKEDKDDNE